MTDWYENEVENARKRQEIEQLNRLGSDCWHEEFAKAEQFYQRTVELADSLNDLSLMLQQRFRLANMQRMQGKHKQALSGYTWLIEVAYDPQKSRDLTEDDLWYIARGFMDFLNAAQSFPEMKAGDRALVCDRALDWLASVGKRDWIAGLRMQRGLILQSQERYEEAVAEMEAALALKRRYPFAPGYYLTSHLLVLADLTLKMAKFKDAESYYREIIDSDGFVEGISRYTQRWAWTGLGEVALDREDFAEAEKCAMKALDLARTIESPRPMYEVYNLLGDIFWKQKHIESAIQAKIQAWHYARKLGEEERFCELYQDMAELRIERSRQNHPARNARKAKRWLHRALPLAIRLDGQVGQSKRQEKIQRLQASCDAILAAS